MTYIYPMTRRGADPDSAADNKIRIARLVHSGCWSGKVILCVSRAIQKPQVAGVLRFLTAFAV